MAPDERTSMVPRHQGSYVFPNTPLFSQLLRHAHRDRLAVRDVHLEVERTYTDVLSDTLKLRSALLKILSKDTCADLDAEREVFVGVLAAGGYEYTIAMLAVLAAGAVPVPMTVQLPRDEAKYFVQKSRQVAIISSTSACKLAGAVAEVVSQDRGRAIPWLEVVSGLRGRAIKAKTMTISSDRQLDEGAAGLVIFTSGTSGPPKGAVLRRGFMSEETRSIIEIYGISPGNTILHLLPVHHATGCMVNFFPFLMAGACIEFRSGSFDAAWTWDRLRRGGIDYFSAVPTIFMRMMRHHQNALSRLPESERYSFELGAKKTRVILCGSSALPRPVQEFWTGLRERPIAVRYGSTEAGAIFFVRPDDLNVPDGSVGKPASGSEVLLSNGEEGQILVKAPYMFSKSVLFAEPLADPDTDQWARYLFDPEATANAHDDNGYFKTGDIAHRENGYYFIDGRASQDIIKSGGYKISALDIEREILSLPYVAEVMVVGVEDNEFGQRVGAALSLRDDQHQYAVLGPRRLKIDVLRQDLRGRLAGYKLPTLLRLVEGELPKTASGKVLKRVLGPRYFPSPGWQDASDVQAWSKNRSEAMAKL